MSTIQDYIHNLATTYSESDIVSQLTERDFLAALALNKSMSHDCDMQCMFRENDAYKQDSDGFIDREVGQFGTRRRIFYESQAQSLYRLAQRYRDAQEPDEAAHPFHQEMASMKARFAVCLPLVSDDPDTELSPEERESFRSKLSFCLAYGKQLPQKSDAIRYIKPSPFHNEQGLGVFYQQLISNHRASASTAPSTEVQIHDAGMALRASSFYQEAPPEIQRAIQHVAEDLINGVDPEHSNYLTGASLLGTFGGDVASLIALYGGAEAASALGLGGLVGVIVGFGTYAAIDYSYHADSVRLHMYNYSSPIECDEATFGENMATDQKCFGYTAFDLGAGLYQGFPDAPQSERMRLINQYPNHVIR